jgi:hypothetical protein
MFQAKSAVLEHVGKYKSGCKRKQTKQQQQVRGKEILNKLVAQDKIGMITDLI